MDQFVIIGLGSAGFSALMTYRRLNPGKKVIIIDPKEEDLMHPCGLPYGLEGSVPLEGLTQNVALEKMKAERIVGYVNSIDKENHSISLSRNGTSEEIPYGKCLIATGSRPFIPPIPGIDTVMGKTLFTLTSMESLIEILNEVKPGEKAAVIGGGAIGLEGAAALTERGMKVSLFEARDHLLPGVLSADLAEEVAQECHSLGIDLHLSSTIDSISAQERCTLSYNDTEESFSLVILAAGFRADTSIAQSSGFSYTSNGITVKETLEITSDVYGAGDCIDSWHLLTGKSTPAKLATSSYHQGEAAARNISGHNEPYRGTTGTFVTKIGLLEAAGTGLSLEEAKEQGFNGATMKITSHLLPDYMPDNSSITLRVVFDRSTGRVLGGQAVGKSGASHRVNLMSMAVKEGLTCKHMTDFEMAYCPSVSEVNDPLHRVFQLAQRRVK